MSKSILNGKALQDEATAIAWVESRVWPNGPVCPHCGGVERIGKMKGKATRPGLWKCYQCRKQFTVKIGTVFEDSHIPMRLWLQAVYLLCSSKKGISSNQLHRTLGVTLKTAWFMSHRIREAMRTVGFEPMGGAGEVVEADETYIGRIEGMPKAKSGGSHKNIVFALVERGGSVRSFHIDGKAIADFMPIIRAHVSAETRMNTDEAKHYYDLSKEFAGHDTVTHSADEYVRYTNVRYFPEGNPYIVTTNSVEGYFSIFKRGMKGVYQHCKEKHLHRYLAEFDFRYNNRVRLGVDDVQRTERAIKGIVGKRLTYRTTNKRAPIWENPA
jgi:transposase-like protein